MATLKKWTRINYTPCLPIGNNNSKITGCEAHIELSRTAAGEGAVLLKNNGNLLPLNAGAKVAIFGNAQIDYVKGGGGSGNVFCEYTRNIYDGLKQKVGKVEVFDSLSLYYKDCVEKLYKENEKPGMLPESEIPASLLVAAKEFTDTAIITINRYSREEEDRRNDGTDTYFVLSAQEKKMVDVVCNNFEKVIVILNTGAMIDTSWFSDNGKISSALMAWQGGMEGGLAVADILVGDVNPSGKLVDTCVSGFEDYPSSEGFHESEDYVKYTEDIFVGYRYFETVPGKKSCVTYPFGFGLSYTTFELSNMSAVAIGEKIIVSADVKNTGSRAGKEVVQVYCSAPVGKITKPAIELCAFAKTKLLSPGEIETLVMSFDISDMASYDDIGDVQKSAYILEAGEYKIFVGNSIRNVTELEYKYVLTENVITQQLTEYCAPQSLGKRLTASGEYISVPDKKITQKKFACEYQCEEKIPAPEEIKPLMSVYLGEISLDDFIAQLTDEEMMRLLIGKPSKGVAHTDGMGGLPKYGIPAPMTTDGPAGVRIHRTIGLKTTAFPVATMLACTWNTELMEEIGHAGALEAKENNLSIWLTPALNIHRSPLCGRNFEYFSEDPFVSGKMAAAKVRGIQSVGIAATLKHFACNNKETNRMESDSIVSERALREIYIKGFEIAVKESKPKLIMTAYNVINGTRASENAELITGILRGEWKFDGLVTTDWRNHADAATEKLAGNDIRMPAMDDGIVEGVDRNQLAICVKRLLELILWLE